MRTPPSFYDLLNATALSGQQAFGVRGERYFHLCLFCKEEFEQTDEGWAALRQHQFEHGAAELFDWADLHGKSLRLVVVPSEGEGSWLSSRYVDVYGVDDASGVVYHLNNKHLYSDEKNARGWKWKIGNPTKQGDGPQPMPNVLALLSSGFESAVEK